MITKEQIEREVKHIFESGANEIRVIELIERLLPRWIPVEEALPGLNKRVIVEYRPDRPVMKGTVIGVDERVYIESLPEQLREKIEARNGFKYYNVVRWQPLPEK